MIEEKEILRALAWSNGFKVTEVYLFYHNYKKLNKNSDIKSFIKYFLQDL
jgi:hypothetical protein